MLSGLLAPAKARADESRNTLLLSVAASPAESARLEAVTRELLAPLGVQVQLRSVPRINLAELRRHSAQPYYARIWIALSASGSATLYLEPGASDRLLVRDVPGDANNPELVREEIGHILQTAVEGLKAGEEVGEPRQQALQQVAPEEPNAVSAARAGKAPPIASTPPRSSSAAAMRTRPRVGIGARYEARWLGDGARFEDGPGAVFALVAPLGFEVGGYYRRAFAIDGEPVGMRLETVSLRALVTLEVWRLRLGVGPGADFVRVRALADAAENVELTGPSWLKLAFGRFQATYGYRATRFVELQVSSGADVDLSGTRYEFVRLAGSTTLLDPAPVRPFLSLGVVLP